MTAETAEKPTPINRDSIAARVARGAALLDENRPGWARKIEPSNLHLESCDSCILGQLYGGYWEGFQTLRMMLPDSFLFSAAAHGFTLPDKDQRFDGVDVPVKVMSRFNFLANAWRVEIARRVSAARGDEGVGGLST